jgi:transposase-like protein
MNDTTTAAIPPRSRKRFNAAERLELVQFGLEQGKSRRQMGRELGCDEATIRRDIKKLSLPEDQQAAIRKGDSAEKHLRQVRYEKTGIDELAVKRKKKRLTKETKTGGDSNDLAELVLDWLTRRGIETSREEILLLESVKAANKKLPDRQGAPSFNPEAEFALCERGKPPRYRSDRINFYINVLSLCSAPDRTAAGHSRCRTQKGLARGGE